MEDNILKEFIDDETFKLLNDNHFFDRIALRDYRIRGLYKELKKANANQAEAVEKIQQEYYPDLQFDTIRRVAYQPTWKYSISAKRWRERQKAKREEQGKEK